MNSSNFSDTQKTRLRRGNHSLHRKLLGRIQTDKTSLMLIKDSICIEANKADKKDKRDSDIGWFFGIIFYGGIGLWILSSITSGTTSSGSNNTSNTSTPN